MVTHSRSTLRVLCRLMQLRSGHVTLLRAEFQPINIIVSAVGLTAPGGPHVVLCPKFLVDFVNMTLLMP